MVQVVVEITRHGTRTHLFGIHNAMAADVLATQEVRALAAMVLT